MDQVFNTLPIENPFSKQDHLKRWMNYRIVDEVIQPVSLLTNGNSQWVDYFLSTKGLLNKLVLKMAVTFSDDGGDASNNWHWIGLQLIEEVKLFCGSVEVMSIKPMDILALIQQASFTDFLIYNAVIPYDKADFAAASTDDTHTFYAPLLLGCYEDVDSLYDTAYMQPFRVSVKYRAVSDALTNNSDAFTIDYHLLAQYIEVFDYDKFYKERYNKLPYQIIQRGLYHEAPLFVDCTANVAQTVVKTRLYCDRLSQMTYIGVTPTATQGMYMDLCEISSVKVWEQGRLIYSVENQNEYFVMHHTEYRHALVKDNISPLNSLVHVIPWGVYTMDNLSNYIDMKQRYLYIELTFMPTQTVNHTVHISHDYFKQLSVDEKGAINDIVY